MDDRYHFVVQILLGIELFCYHVGCYLCVIAVCIVQLNGFITILVDQSLSKKYVVIDLLYIHNVQYLCQLILMILESKHNNFKG